MGKQAQKKTGRGRFGRLGKIRERNANRSLSGVRHGRWVKRPLSQHTRDSRRDHKDNVNCGQRKKKNIVGDWMVLLRQTKTKKGIDRCQTRGKEAFNAIRKKSQPALDRNRLKKKRRHKERQSEDITYNGVQRKRGKGETGV